ncbi:MAG: D-cysteine desulfhydrase family protein [Pseudomonadota bacterium]
MADPFAALARFPRVVLGRETPVEQVANLSNFLGSEVRIKRDDMQGLAFGGNKVRQLEYYFGAAREAGADTVLITGAVQSNFARLTAAFAAKLAMECHIQLEDRVRDMDESYRISGNVLVERLLGAAFHPYPDGEDEAGADARLEVLAGELSGAGRTPYVIHLAPGHPPLGALGYVDCAREVLAEAQAVDEIIVASGSGATHGGLLFGLRALGCQTPVTGICVRRPAAAQSTRILHRTEEIAGLLGVANPVTQADVVLDDLALAPGYGRLNPATEEAILLAARAEALMLDPVYTGKAMAGLIASARALPGRRLLFLHTGGTPGLFAYAPALTAAAAP